MGRKQRYRGGNGYGCERAVEERATDHAVGVAVTPFGF
jgi:hypothetical protein